MQTPLVECIDLACICLYLQDIINVDITLSISVLLHNFTQQSMFCVGAFMAFGLSGCVPVIHHIITDGYHEAVNFAALGTLIPMALLYLSGALIYAARFPESVWPGKFNFWVRRLCRLRVK